MRVLDCFDEPGEKCGAARDIVYDDMLVFCMSAGAIDAQSIQNGDSQGGNEVAVRASAD